MAPKRRVGAIKLLYVNNVAHETNPNEAKIEATKSFRLDIPSGTKPKTKPLSLSKTRQFRNEPNWGGMATLIPQLRDQDKFLAPKVHRRHTSVSELHSLLG